MTTTVTTAVTLLIIAVGVNSAVYSGYNVNHLDLSPNHSGTLMGITNCVSNICSLMAPLVVQMVVTHEEDQSQWKIIFFLAASIYIASNAVFVLFGSGEVQSWNDSGAHDKGTILCFIICYRFFLIINFVIVILQMNKINNIKVHPFYDCDIVQNEFNV